MAPPSRQVPGVTDAYGFDAGSGRLVHIHAHYQLVIGHDATKNYRLPIEEAYLASATRSGLFRVPAPEFEFAVFVVRMMLKHGTWDALVRQQTALSKSERRELEYLSARLERGRLWTLIADNLPLIDRALFERCERSLSPDALIRSRIKNGYELERRLAGYARRHRVTDTFLKLWRRGSWGIRRIAIDRWTRMRLEEGGALVAVVGGDGAGKSAAVSDLNAWLSRHFMVVKVHLGKPPRSFPTLAVKTLLFVGRLTGKDAPQTSLTTSPQASTLAIRGQIGLLRDALIARDRYRTYVRARRIAARGGIAICDRYPIPQIKLMEAARMTNLDRSAEAGWFGVFARREAQYYSKILEPDILIVLRVNPEIALERKPDEDETFVRARSGEIWELDWTGTTAMVIDAGRSRAEVLAEIKSLVWSRL